jgi:Transposase DDE domain
MANSNLLESIRISKQELRIPQEMEGVSKMLESLGLKEKFIAADMDFTLVLLGIGQKLRKATSEIAFLALWGLSSFQRRYNRFLHKAQAEIIFSTLLKTLPPKIFSDPNGVIILDDSPLPKSGKKMQGAKKFYHNGSFFHGYELPALVYSGTAGNFPLAFALKTKESSSKLDLSMEMIQKTLKILPRPRWVLFDSWFTVKPLLEFLFAQGLLAIAPVKSNRQFVYRGRLYPAKEFVRLAKHEKYASFEVSCPWHPKLRLVVFRRKLSSKKNRHEILLTNDLASTPREIAKAYLRRWAIETVFRTFKQSFALNHFHNRTLAAIHNHIALAFCALLLVAYLKSLFRSLREKSLAWIRAFVFFVRKRYRCLLSSGLLVETELIYPNHRYFKRFNLVPLNV